LLKRSTLLLFLSTFFKAAIDSEQDDMVRGGAEPGFLSSLASDPSLRSG
jgi:hypothetical protein